MNDNNHDPYRLPDPQPVEPERFERQPEPAPPEPADLYVSPGTLTVGAGDPYADPERTIPETYGPPAPNVAPDPFGSEPSTAPEPLITVEPIPAMAGGMIAPAPLNAGMSPEAADVRGLRASRVVEEVVAWLKTLASAAVYATLIVTFGFQVARVEGQSMAPTLADQDRLIVNKLAYRLGEPHVGDIVMLYYPLNPEKSFVKRVIAEEGDQVRIVDGRVYRNDVLIDDDYVPNEYRSHDDWGPEVIPEGYYFVMGDHRNNSSDSRHWRFVPKKYIIGKVQLRWWPLPQAKIF